MSGNAADQRGPMMADDTMAFKGNRSTFSKARILVIALLVVAVVILIIGIVLIALANKKSKECAANEAEKGSTEKQSASSFCEYSEEAKRIDLDRILSNVKSKYYELHPFDLPGKPSVTKEELKENYKAYHPSPSNIKKITDSAWALLDEVNKTEVSSDKLKPRERKSLSQLKHYLKTVFGQPFDMNYYAGDWMMGPTFICKQPICRQGQHVHDMLKVLKPENLADLKLIEEKLQTHQAGILRYIENLKLGKLHGMVYSQEACVAGRDSLKRRYLNIALKNETGVLDESYAKPFLMDDYYSDLTAEMKDEWKKDHDGKSVTDSVKEYLVEYLGKPVTELIRYLQYEHYHYCPPSNISSGLASLPLSHVWFKGNKNSSWPTVTSLEGDHKLDGKKSYSMILPYFTTNDMTPMDVHNLGKKQLAILYPMALEAAKRETGKDNETEAVEEFKRELNSTDNFFNEQPFPSNESDENAHQKCSTIPGAKMYCPKRWETLQRWFKEARAVMSMLYPKIVDLFHFAGDKHTTPNCPVDLRPDLNPSSGIQSYDGSDPMCKTTAFYNIPFFINRLGPKFSEWSINAHEARPGHQIQIQGTREHFQDTCGGVIGWLDSKTYYTAFLEGWALYAENPLIAEDTDVYDGEPMKQYGMLKWQIWRAVRMIVDTGLHYTGMKREEAIKYFVDHAWDDSDFTRKEVTRYQSWPGQSTAYMVGQMGILETRRNAEEELTSKFDIKDYHFQVLSQGSSPLAFLTEHIGKYVECVKMPNTEGCNDILHPPRRKPPKSGDNSASSLYFFADRHYA